MPKCQKCYDVFPPQFTELIDGIEHHMCIFCKDSVDSIMYEDDNGERKKYTKKDCSRDYKKFLRMVKEKNNVLLKEKQLGVN
jgi:hypothetical protein